MEQHGALARRMTPVLSSVSTGPEVRCVALFEQ